MTSTTSTWGYNTTAAEVSTTLSSQITNKTILITGVTPGTLGSAVAQTIASHNPALLILAGRSYATLTSTRATLPASTHTQLLTVDLTSSASVRAAASLLTHPIDVLINNAAVMATRYGVSADGHEQQFAAGHLGHFLLTCLLAGAGVLRRGESRIVNVASSGHRMGGVRWEDPGFQEGGVYDKWAAYAQAKTANVLFTRALAQRGWGALCLHPGEVADTRLGGYLPVEELEYLKVAYPQTKTIEQGAATHLVAAFSPDLLPEHNGAYLVDCQVANDQLAEHATGDENVERLWKLSEEMVGQNFDL